MTITGFGSITRTQQDAAVNHYERMLRQQFAEMDWCLTRWLFLVGLHLATQNDSPEVRWNEHKLTYRDFTSLQKDLDDAKVCDIVRQMTVILMGDVSQTVSITHAGSQVVLTLHTPQQV